MQITLAKPRPSLDDAAVDLAWGRPVGDHGASSPGCSQTDCGVAEPKISMSEGFKAQQIRADRRRPSFITSRLI